jgi:hypothetical protein
VASFYETTTKNPIDSRQTFYPRLVKIIKIYVLTFFIRILERFTRCSLSAGHRPRTKHENAILSSQMRPTTLFIMVKLNETISLNENSLQHDETILADAVNLHNEFANALNLLSLQWTPKSL